MGGVADILAGVTKWQQARREGEREVSTSSIRKSIDTTKPHSGAKPQKSANRATNYLVALDKIKATRRTVDSLDALLRRYRRQGGYLWEVEQDLEKALAKMKRHLEELEQQLPPAPYSGKRSNRGQKEPARARAPFVIRNLTEMKRIAERDLHIDSQSFSKQAVMARVKVEHLDRVFGSTIELKDAARKIQQ